jgi:FkbM family methyltransferase
MTIVGRAFKAAVYISKCRLRKIEAKARGIVHVEPNYVYFDRFDSSSVIIDVGCGYDADFSLHMVEKYNLRSFVVDPTRKHMNPLQTLEKIYSGNIVHLNVAVASVAGKMIFHESDENVSGSILVDHNNIINDTLTSYEVEAVTLKGLLDRVKVPVVDYLKLDIEGAEYELLKNVGEDDWSPFKQIFVEFHHHCIKSYSINDTKSIVWSMQKKGFRSFSLDDRNYLFFR